MIIKKTTYIKNKGKDKKFLSLIDEDSLRCDYKGCEDVGEFILRIDELNFNGFKPAKSDVYYKLCVRHVDAFALSEHHKRFTPIHYTDNIVYIECFNCGSWRNPRYFKKPYWFIPKVCGKCKNKIIPAIQVSEY